MMIHSNCTLSHMLGDFRRNVLQLPHPSDSMSIYTTSFEDNIETMALYPCALATIIGV